MCFQCGTPLIVEKGVIERKSVYSTVEVSVLPLPCAIGPCRLVPEQGVVHARMPDLHGCVVVS